LRASRSIECQNTVSPSRTKLCMASSWGRFTSLPEALSIKVYPGPVLRAGGFRFDPGN
jgi:hypothetical protein